MIAIDIPPTAMYDYHAMIIAQPNHLDLRIRKPVGL